MTLLFINSSSKVYHDDDGMFYLNPHTTNEGFRQYLRFCDKLILLLRDAGHISKAEGRLEKFDVSIGKIIIYPNIYSIKGFFSISKQKELRSLIQSAVNKADRVICGTSSGAVIKIAVKYCNKFHKPYMMICLGMMFEGQWYHSLKGKIIAFPREIMCRKLIKHAPYVIYVTEEACQKRYPSNGKTLGCSDVELPDIEPNVLEKRLSKFANVDRKIVIGTAAYLDVKWKGHHVLLKALARLREKGYDFEYQMIGLGTGKRIIELAQKLNLQEYIKILGGRPHKEVFEWYDNIDLYVQPSFQEGLCRSIVEAMSRACPVICSDAGGNYELIDNRFVVPKGKDEKLADALEDMISGDNLILQARANFEKSKYYNKSDLNKKRWDFIEKFIKNE